MASGKQNKRHLEAVLNLAAVRKCQLSDRSFLSNVAMNDENANVLTTLRFFVVNKYKVCSRETNKCINRIQGLFP